MTAACCSDFFAATSDDIDRLLDEPLLREWEELANRVQVSPFMQAGWVLAWWRAFGAGDGGKLAIWTLRNKGRVTALLPLVQSGGCLRSATNCHTPQSGLLAEHADAAAMLLRAVLNSGARHVVLEGLDPLGQDPDICTSAALATGRRQLFLPDERNCFLDLQGSWETYSSGLSRNLANDLRRSRRRLAAKGNVTVEVDSGKHRLHQLLQEVFAVEAAGWKLRNRTAILSSPVTERFYRDVAQWAAAHDMLRIYTLRLDGRPLAMLFGLEHRGVRHLLKGGYDEEFSHYSPGNLLMHEFIRRCFADGIARIEFHGDAEDYKLRWRPATRDLQRFHAFPHTMPGHFAWVCATLRPWLKVLLVRS